MLPAVPVGIPAGAVSLTLLLSVHRLSCSVGFSCLDGEWWPASPEQKRGWIFEGGVGVRRVWTVPPPVALILSGSLAGLPGVRGCNVGR